MFLQLLHSLIILRIWEYKFAFKGGLSFSLGDIKVPDEKEPLIASAREK